MTSALEMSSSFLTPLIAIVALYIAYEQYRTNRWRARESVFDRRLAVFQATSEFIHQVLAETNPSVEEVTSFRQATAAAPFLFGDDVRVYLDELLEKGIRCRQAYGRLARAAGEGQVDSEAVDLDTGLVTWFTNQFDESRARFGRYMNLGRR